MAVLTLGPSGPVDGPVLTQSLQRLLQGGDVHLTGSQHPEELCLPLRLIPRQLELTLLRDIITTDEEVLSSTEKNRYY